MIKNLKPQNLNFIVKKKEGLNYAKVSGDNNKIHINEKYGYNSIFAKNIVHGTLIIKKFIKKIKFKESSEFCINIDFKNAFSYEDKIFIKINVSNKLIKYFLIQNNKVGGVIFIKKILKKKVNILR